jgi:hypothetical protein
MAGTSPTMRKVNRSEGWYCADIDRRRNHATVPALVMQRILSRLDLTLPRTREINPASAWHRHHTVCSATQFIKKFLKNIKEIRTRYQYCGSPPSGCNPLPFAVRLIRNVAEMS